MNKRKFFTAIIATFVLVASASLVLAGCGSNRGESDSGSQRAPNPAGTIYLNSFINGNFGVGAELQGVLSQSGWPTTSRDAYVERKNGAYSHTQMFYAGEGATFPENLSAVRVWNGLAKSEPVTYTLEIAASQNNIVKRNLNAPFSGQYWAFYKDATKRLIEVTLIVNDNRHVGRYFAADMIIMAAADAPGQITSKIVGDTGEYAFTRGWSNANGHLPIGTNISLTSTTEAGIAAKRSAFGGVTTTVYFDAGAGHIIPQTAKALKIGDVGIGDKSIVRPSGGYFNPEWTTIEGVADFRVYYAFGATTYQRVVVELRNINHAAFVDTPLLITATPAPALEA